MDRKFSLPRSIIVGFRFTIVTIILLAICTMAILKGNTLKDPEEKLNYIVMVNTVDHFEKRSCDRAIEYLKKHPKTILVMAAASNDDAELEINKELQAYLEEQKIEKKQMLLFPKAMGQWSLVKNCLAYIKTDWYGKDEEVINDPKIGLITQELDTYEYVQYFKRETSMKIYEIAAKVPFLSMPKLVLKEWKQFIILHIQEKI